MRCKENSKPTFCGCFSHLFNTKKVLFIFIGVIVDQNVIITWNQHTHRFTAVELDRIVLFLLFFSLLNLCGKSEAVFVFVFVFEYALHGNYESSVF